MAVRFILEGEGRTQIRGCAFFSTLPPPPLAIFTSAVCRRDSVVVVVLFDITHNDYCDEFCILRENRMRKSSPGECRWAEIEE